MLVVECEIFIPIYSNTYLMKPAKTAFHDIPITWRKRN
ncbi:hypothetical protein Q7O_000947 [Pectobacterium carotovorum subsp. carotovorum PCCS1]|nr:hypothetical protein [Pectobacterium carotovorum subsp. carotovorum PCCS1]